MSIKKPQIKISCIKCKKEFKVRRSYYNYKIKHSPIKYCSKICFYKDNPPIFSKIKCNFCGQDFKVKKCREKIAKFCRYKCYYKSKKGEPSLRKLILPEKEIIELYLNQNLSVNKIAKKFNCSFAPISRILREDGTNE